MQSEVVPFGRRNSYPDRGAAVLRLRRRCRRAMRQRLAVNEAGELVGRDGTVLGRITAISIDFYGVGGDVGAVQEKANNRTTTPPPPAEGPKLFEAPDELHRLWAIYQQVVPGGGRRTLDSTRISCIRRALKARSFEECEWAIRALARSDWHNGANPQKTNYLDITYALGRKGDSADVIIDRWLERSPAAASHGGVSKLSDLLPAGLEQAVKDIVFEDVGRVRQAIGSVHAPTIEAGRQAEGRLRGRPACAEPVIVNSKIVGWKRVGT